MTEFINVERFVEWLTEKSKIFTPDNLQVWLDELESQYACNGSPEYELKPRETFSGHPELYRFEVIDKFFIDGRELTDDEVSEGADWDEIERTIVF